jgi:hypothetical protein
MINKLLLNLSSTSGPGASGISSKILKASAFQLTPLIKDLFNTCIDWCSIPDDWKLAIITIELLILKLKCYGFHYSSLSLIKSYFTNRQQRVKINGTLSAPQAIQLSVPQGSVLGPLFFLLFINDLAMFF